jgi:hypothetical protein
MPNSIHRDVCCLFSCLIYIRQVGHDVTELIKMVILWRICSKQELWRQRNSCC